MNIAQCFRCDALKKPAITWRPHHLRPDLLPRASGWSDQNRAVAAADMDRKVEFERLSRHVLDTCGKAPLRRSSANAELGFRIAVELGNRFAKRDIPELQDAAPPSQRLACVDLFEGGNGAVAHDNTVTGDEHGCSHIFLPAIDFPPGARVSLLPAATMEGRVPSPVVEVVFSASRLGTGSRSVKRWACY